MRALRHWGLGATLLLALSSTALAESTPDRGRHDARVRVAHYVDGQVYRVATTVLNVTTIEFGSGETITSIVAGDTEGFQLDGVPGGQAFAVKPVVPGAATNITVYTNQRSYYFNVVEGGDPTFFVVRFSYPQAATQPSNAVVAQAPNARYRASGTAEFRPTSVWDDGTFTYFAFPRNVPLPAILRVGAGGERSVNSTAQANGVLRVSGVSREWVLRLGDEVVCIEALAPEGTR